MTVKKLGLIPSQTLPHKCNCPAIGNTPIGTLFQCNECPQHWLIKLGPHGYGIWKKVTAHQARRLLRELPSTPVAPAVKRPPEMGTNNTISTEGFEG